MTLNEQQQEIAETLYHAWKACKDHACLERRLSRIADDLQNLSCAIRSELEGGQARKLVRYQQEQTFDITVANQSVGNRKTIELPTVDTLRSLTDQWRSACDEKERRDKEKEGL